MKDKTVISVCTIFCITMIEIMALAMGHDGTMIMLSIGAIGAVGGYAFPHKKE